MTMLNFSSIFPCPYNMPKIRLVIPIINYKNFTVSWRASVGVLI